MSKLIVLLAKFGVVVALITIAGFAVLGLFQLSILGIFGLLGLILFLYTHSKSANDLKFSIPEKSAGIMVLVGVNIAILILIILGNPVFRPAIFFLILSITFGLITIAIETTKLRFSLLVLIILVSYIYKFTFFIRNLPTQDVVNHIQRTTVVMNTGSPIQTYPPIYHIYWSEISMIFDIPVIQSRFIMMLIPSLGVLFVYILSDQLFTDSRLSLHAATIFGFFTLVNRVKLQPEALAFPIYISLLTYFIFSRFNRIKKYAIILMIFAALLFTHEYYPGIIVQLFIIIAIVSISFQKLGSTLSYTTVHENVVLSFIFGIPWLLFVWDRLETVWNGVLNLIRPFQPLTPPDSGTQLSETTGATGATTGATSTTTGATGAIQPAHTTGAITILEFILLHLSELLIISLAIIAILRVFQYDNNKRIIFVATFSIFSFVSLLGMIIEATSGGPQRWNLFFRNAYLIAIFICILGGAGLLIYLKNFNRSVFKPPYSTIASIFFILIIITSLSVFSLTSSQANQVDPVLYPGEVSSPHVFTKQQTAALKTVIPYLPSGSIILSDRMTLNNLIINVHTAAERNLTRQVFSYPGLRGLSQEHDYLIINSITNEKGFVFSMGKSANIHGLKHDKATLINHGIANDKIWVGGRLKIYR